MSEQDNGAGGDEMFPPPDPYHEVAWMHTMLECDSCGALLDSDDIEGAPKYPDDGWYEALGNTARERGWDIREDDHGIFGFAMICPSCVINRRGRVASA